jgi:hypothetical protein
MINKNNCTKNSVRILGSKAPQPPVGEYLAGKFLLFAQENIWLAFVLIIQKQPNIYLPINNQCPKSTPPPGAGGLNPKLKCSTKTNQLPIANHLNPSFHVN